MKVIAVNKKASFKFEFIEKFEAGIVLEGSEIKSLIKGNIDISEAYIMFKENEAFLLNAVIAKYQHQNTFDHDPRRTRKLLLHKKEIQKMIFEKQKFSYTIVPTKIYMVNALAKVEIALAKGKSEIDKKAVIKARDLKRINAGETKHFHKFK